jgi:hypothetical protein
MLSRLRITSIPPFHPNVALHPLRSVK